jgi:predicted Zn finger-like uncharacterized protein
MWKKASWHTGFAPACLARRIPTMLYPSMIIACPACSTRYVVPDTAIGPEGRTVRCAKCRHSWFQDGPELLLAEVPAAVVAEPVAPPAAAPVPAPVPAAEPPALAEPEPEPPLAEPPPPQRDYDYYDEADERSSFEHEPPFRPRRNMLKMWTLAALVFAVVTLGVLGAVSWFGLPDWLPVARTTFAEAQPDLVLDFPPNRQERRTLPGGAEYFGASGTITNAGPSRRSVPTILIVLRDARERIVYSWEVVPPKRQLAPGESVTINEAVTDVPRNAKFAEIGWKPG